MFCKPVTGIFIAAVEPDKLYVLIPPWFKCRKGLFPEKKSKIVSRPSFISQSGISGRMMGKKNTLSISIDDEETA